MAQTVAGALGEGTEKLELKYSGFLRVTNVLTCVANN
jgi:hypothetical protein